MHSESKWYYGRVSCWLIISPRVINLTILFDGIVTGLQYSVMPWFKWTMRMMTFISSKNFNRIPSAFKSPGCYFPQQVDWTKWFNKIASVFTRYHTTRFSFVERLKRWSSRQKSAKVDELRASVEREYAKIPNVSRYLRIYWRAFSAVS